jgi:hypothetical protein
MYLSQLNDFMALAAVDMRIGTPHISLYVVLFQYWVANGCSKRFTIFRRDIMTRAKINSKATYHKCVKDLHEFGYIRYSPSRAPGQGSSVDICTVALNNAGLDHLVP